MTLQEIRTATITSKGQVAIPKDLRARAGLREGDKVVILAFPDRVEILPLDEFAQRFGPLLLSRDSLGNDWDRPEEEEAWKDL